MKAAAELRRKLLAKGLTKLPTCEACRVEVKPRDMVAGLCPGCKRHHDEALAYMDRLRDETDMGPPELGRGSEYTEGLEVDE